MKYPGLYRGYVIDNDDSGEEHPFLGRIKVSVPEVYGEANNTEDLPWAWPCIQGFSGGIYDSENDQMDNTGTVDEEKTLTSGMIAIPPIGATVWVMFEQGDPQVPVYLGTWIGKQAEMPAAAKSAEGVPYPKVFVLKMPWGKDMYLRAISDKVFELRFDDMHIQMKAETSPGAADGELFVWTESTNIRLASTDGNITLQAKEINAYAKTNMKLYAGEFETDPLTGESTVKTVGDLAIQSTRDTGVYGYEKTKVAAGPTGEIQGQAPKASGFDKHGDFPVI